MSADAATTTLLCSCGLRLKARGAVPGRLGRCPKCGALLRVPEAAAGPAPSSNDIPIDFADKGSDPEGDGLPPAASPAFVSHRARPSAGPAPAQKVAAPERHWYQGLGYPLSGDGGISLLVFMPAGLAFLTTVLLHVAPLIFFENFFAGAAMALALGTLLLMALALGMTCQHLGGFLAASAAGDASHPRWPEFDAFEILRALGRWLLVAAGGLALGGGLGIMDARGLGEAAGFGQRAAVGALLSLGTFYGLMALLAVTLFEDVRAANPLTVLRAAVVAGAGYLRACLLAGALVTTATVAASYLVEVTALPAQAAGLWLFWACLLYGTLVVLRVLGLCHHRRAAAIGWFRSRD
ncbi:MAG TPA: hypothetical protein VG406_20015 [Isosphaeraceae bacterium]|jgi:hypothetical protein|nr:hypothetical protein [Isosphaeraceae bacterium]